MNIQRRPYIYNVPNLKPKRQTLCNHATIPEQILWKLLKNSQTGYKFRRQFSVRGYILDFYCPHQKLAIELDGSIHKLSQEYDRYRTKYLEAFGIKVIRFTNNQIEKNIAVCLEIIKKFLSPPPA